MKPVVIVGAGLAGLTCARALKRHFVPFQILEATDEVGGKLKTDEVGNYRLDWGYQVYFTGYPTAKKELDEDKLQLQKFDAGAVVVWDGEHHQINRNNPLQAAFSSFLGMADKMRLAKWTSDIGWFDWDEIIDQEDETIERYLRREGFSEDFIERFARPFFGGIFLDRSLSDSCLQLIFVMKALLEGETVMPAFGIQEIPNQIALTFGHEVLRTGAPVEEVLTENGAVTGVRLKGGEVVEASQVVLACEAPEAERLTGLKFGLEYKHSITLYFVAPTQPIEEPTLVLNGNMRGITNHVVPLSNVNPFVGPIESHLVSATILGERPETDEQLAEIIKSEMRVWFPGRDTDEWTFLRGYRIKNAQMKQPPGIWHRLPQAETGVEGLLLAGAYTVDDSIDGAMRSGLDAAELILERAGVAV